MNSKTKLIIVISIIGLLAGGFLFYKIIQYQKPAHPEFQAFFKYQILNDQLTDQQKEQLVNSFLVTKAVLEENPDDFDAWLNLAGIKKTFKDFKGAEAIWIYAGKTRPQNSISFANLGDLYANFLKDYPKAEQAYQTAIKNSAQDAAGNDYYYRNLYELYYYHLKNNDQAIKALEEGIESNLESTQLLVLAADYYYQIGEREKAIEYLKRALKIAPAEEAIKRELERMKGDT